MTPETSDKPKYTVESLKRSSLFMEQAATGLSRAILEQEFRYELMGRSGIAVYREMDLNEPVLGGLRFMNETIMCSPQRKWGNKPVDSSSEAKAAKEFCDTLLEDLSHPLTNVIRDYQQVIPYGCAWHEMVWKTSNGDSSDVAESSMFTDGKRRLHKIVGRSITCLEDFLTFDNTDDLKGAKFRFPGKDQPVEMDLFGKSIHYVMSPNLNDPWGMSGYRRAYKPYHFKKRFETFASICVERDMTGFPVLSPPEGTDLWNADDPAMVELHSRAMRFLKSLRLNEIAGAALPSGWVLELLKGGGERQIDMLAFITLLEHRMAMVASSDVLMLGQEQIGSKALAEVKLDTCIIGMESHCQNFADGFRRYVYKPAMRYNGFPEKLAPHLVHAPIKLPELGAFAAFINALANAKYPFWKDEKLMTALLDRFSLPSPENPEEMEPVEEPTDKPSKIAA